MTSRERVVTALARKEPDRVPFCELGVDHGVIRKITGENKETFTENELSRAIGRDNITSWQIGAKQYLVTKKAPDGREYVVDGMIKTRDDVKKIVKLPDPTDPSLYKPIQEFLANREDFATCVVINLGTDPVILGMGMETFGCALYDDRALVEELLEIYTDWYAVAAGRLSRMGFDFIWAADDIAFKTAPMFSPKVYRELMLPRLRKVADAITIPWVFHSDGNLMPVIEDLLSLGMDGLHPIEPGAMDIEAFKRDYGDRVCPIGNINLTTLTLGTEEDVEREVRERIERIGPGGGYMISSANTIASYCKPENVLAISRAIRRYGNYPLTM